MFGDDKCSRVCLGVSVVFGIVIALLAYLRADLNMLVSLILALLAFAVGYWLLKMMFCGETGEGAMSSAADTSQPTSAVAATSAAGAAEASTSAAASASTSTSAKTDAPEETWTDSVSAASGKAGDARGATGLKPSATLADEGTLRDGVGSWKYEGEDSATASDGSDASAAPPAATAPTAAKEGDYDGDGVVEGTDEGEKPATLTEAREGGADDLKQIKGVGPKMEALLNSLGFFHFDQVASWSDQEVAWVDANLEGFKGRVSRDSWVAQAKILADGGETEFSKKVEDGGVY